MECGLDSVRQLAGIESLGHICYLGCCDIVKCDSFHSDEHMEETMMKSTQVRLTQENVFRFVREAGQASVNDVRSKLDFGCTYTPSATKKVLERLLHLGALTFDHVTKHYSVHTTAMTVAEHKEQIAMLKKRSQYRKTVCSGCRHNYYNYPKAKSDAVGVAVGETSSCWFMGRVRNNKCDMHS